MNYRVHFGFYVDVLDVESAAKARQVAGEVFLVGDLIDSQVKNKEGLSRQELLAGIRKHLLDRARAWFQRTELRP